jgi:hypothetical protein
MPKLDLSPSKFDLNQKGVLSNIVTLKAAAKIELLFSKMASAAGLLNIYVRL